ncbi:nuclear transport factor 2 family protein [Pedomonas sp. V897]|uniref:nuclear transport factor 2 family protein n=1 Tax=Pedomonas sp. V897 TaxID=3446482 RepID=UPI003EE058B0
MSDKPFDLEAEVRDLAARRDIYNVACVYMRGQDRLLPELHRSAFHDDAYVDCGLYAGSADGFVEFAQGFLGELKSSHHLIGQVHIDVQGDVADGEVYFIAYHRIVENGEDKDLIVAGRYVDRYEKRDGVWKIARRREIVDWARTDPASDSFLREQTALHLGGRRNEDFSVTRNWPPEAGQR